MTGVITHKDICVIDDGVGDQEHAKVLQLLTESLWRYGWPYPYSALDRPCWHSFIAGTRRNE